MQDKKLRETRGEAAPYVCILALAANNSATDNLKERRIREQLQTENRLSIATPSCESVGLDRGRCPKSVAKLYSGQAKNKRDKHITRHSDVVKLAHPTDILPNNSVTARDRSACAANNVASGQNSEIVPKKRRSKRKRRNAVEIDKETVQSEIANLMTCSPVDKELVSPLLGNSFSTEDSEVQNNAAVNIALGKISEIIPKKQRSKRKRRNSVGSDKETVQSEIANLMTSSPVDKELVSPLLVNSFSTEDLEVKNNVAGYCFSGGRKAIQGCKRHTIAESTVISPDLEVGCCRPTRNLTNIFSRLISEGKPVSAVNSKVDISLVENNDDRERDPNVSSKMTIQRTYQRTCRMVYGLKTYGRKRKIVCPLKSNGKPVSAVDSKVDVNLVENHDDHEWVPNISSKMNIQKTYKRTRRIIDGVENCGWKGKIDSNIVNSNYIWEDTDSLVLFVQDRMENTPLDHSVAALSVGCAEDLNEKELAEQQRSQLQVVEDLVEKVVDGCTGVESLEMKNERSMEMDNSKETTTVGCHDKDMPLVDSSKQNFQQSERAKPDQVMDMQGDSRISHVGKEFDNEPGKILPDDPVDKHSIPLLSDLSNSRDGVTQVDKDVNISLERSLIGSSRKKLLVLDINGLLADIVLDVPHRYKPDEIVSGKAVFKRPFCDDFLQFCFARFSVGVWSSRMKRNVELILDCLMGDAKRKLLFCWDQYHCTDTGFNTVENREKPLLVKKLKKLWEKYEPNLPWERGDYNETNTLLLDDCPYKALGSPPHTAIFPHSYRHTDEKDNSLGPGGALRLYLEGVANAENVQKYVEENPFGQRPITEKNLSWRFYCKVVEAISSASRDTPNRYSRVNFQLRANR